MFTAAPSGEIHRGCPSSAPARRAQGTPSHHPRSNRMTAVGVSMPRTHLVAAVAPAVTTMAAVTVTLNPPADAARGGGGGLRPYIVTLKDARDARTVAADLRARVRRYYSAVLPGFAAELTRDQAARLGR